MTPRRGVSAALVAVLLWVTVPAVGALETTPGYTEVQQAFLREDFFGSAQRASRFLTEHPRAEEASRVSIWLAVSLDRLQRANDALVTLERLKPQLPPKDARWAEVLFWEGDISRSDPQFPTRS